MAEGLKFHYDVAGAEPIVRDIRVYNVGALEMGTAMCAGVVATAENCGAASVADSNVLQNIIGVLNEDLSAANCLSIVAEAEDFYGKIIINPFAVWLGLYSTHADDDNVTTTTTSKVLTATMVTDHERAWCYVTDTGSSTGGFGNLFQAGSSGGGTTAITAGTDWDDNLSSTTTANTDTFIVMPAAFTAGDVAAGGFDMSEATGQISMQLQGYQGTGTGAMIPLENYITSKYRPMEPLVANKHSGYNFKDEDPKFYADVIFPEHILAGDSTRQIA